MKTTQYPWRIAAAIAMTGAALAPLTARSATTECAKHYALGEAPEITNIKMQTAARELCFIGFGVMHSGITRTPLWSAEHLTRESLAQAKGLKRVNSFHEEPRLPAGERAELRDYLRSGKDRGHQFPNGDAATPEIQFESFTLANMIPQDPDNNRNLWEGIESSVRKLAKQRGELYVITGPLFVGATIERLNGRVMVPTNIYKVVYDPRSKQAAAYVTPNEPGMNYEVVSIAELEKQAGINFSPTCRRKLRFPKWTFPLRPFTVNRSLRGMVVLMGHTKLVRSMSQTRP